MTRMVIRSLFLIGLVLSVLAPVVSAQPGGGGHDMIRTELDRTREMLDRAADMIRSTDCPLAAAPLEAARSIQEKAEQNFQNGLELVAHSQTQQAREYIKTALANCRPTEQGEAVVQRSLERAQELLDRAGGALADNPNRNLGAIYESAKDNLTRAWEFYRQKQYKPAIKLGEQVEKMAWKILGADTRQEQRQETYDRRRENVLRVLEQARSAVVECGSETAQSRLAQAEEAFVVAEQFRRQGQLGPALAALLKCRELATKSLAECDSTDRLELRYNRLRTQLDDLRERSSTLDAISREAVGKLLDQVARQLTLAQESLAGGESDKALAALQAAQLMLRQTEAYFQ